MSDTWTLFQRLPSKGGSQRSLVAYVAVAVDKNSTHLGVGIAARSGFALSFGAPLTVLSLLPATHICMQDSVHQLEGVRASISVITFCVPDRTMEGLVSKLRSPYRLEARVVTSAQPPVRITAQRLAGLGRQMVQNRTRPNPDTEMSKIIASLYA